MAPRKGLLSFAFFLPISKYLKGLDSLYYNRYDSALMEGGETHGAGLLLQMPEEGGNQEPPERYLEEQKASNARKLPILRNQGIPNRQGLIGSVCPSQSAKMPG